MGKLNLPVPADGRVVNDELTYLINNAVYNVKDFGAKGDGVRDDTGSIQNAIDACVRGGGGTVLFPVGTYAVGLTLTLPQNGTRVVCWRGERGRTTTGGSRILKTFNGTLFEQIGEESVSGHASGIRIRDIVIDGNGKTGSLLDFRGILNFVQLNGVVFYNSLGRAVFGRALENSSIRECRFGKCGDAASSTPVVELNVSDPAYSIVGSQTNGVWFTDNHFERNEGTDLLITNTQRNTSACVDVTLAGGKFEHSSTQIHPAVTIEAGWNVLLDTVWNSGASGAAAHAVQVVGNASFTNLNVTIRGHINYTAAADATTPDYNIYVNRVNGLVVDCQMQGARVANLYFDNTGLIWRARVMPSCTFATLRAGGVAIGGSGFPQFGLGAIQSRGNADATLDATQGSAELQQFATALTTNRTITLNTTMGTPKGERFRIVRTATGAFTLSVGGLKSLNVNEWCVVVFDGAAWFLEAFGTL
jgi:hypothetical protein